jgi:hypothetical protein
MTIIYTGKSYTYTTATIERFRRRVVRFFSN